MLRLGDGSEHQSNQSAIRLFIFGEHALGYSREVSSWLRFADVQLFSDSCQCLASLWTDTVQLGTVDPVLGCGHSRAVHCPPRTPTP